MKNISLILALFCAIGVSAKELKVLMIGNSFSQSVLNYLPKIVAADKTNKLTLANAYIGGCTLQRHCANIDAEKTKPQNKPYGYNTPGKWGRKVKLSEAIKAEKWDIITIQQSSHHSPYEDKTQAYGKKLIDFIRKLAPQAEIVVHQTWAYRIDHPWFTKKNATLTRQKMHDMLTANYEKLAKSHGLRMIPMGNAVQIFREKLPVKAAKYSAADLKKLKYPDVIDITGGDVVGYTKWLKNRKTSKFRLTVDRYHLNSNGAFMQGCVWYMFLFNTKASDIKMQFKSPHTKLLIECAEAAVNAIRAKK